MFYHCAPPFHERVRHSQLLDARTRVRALLICLLLNLLRERDWNQGSRLGTEPWQMMKRKMKNFESVEDAEAFALHAGISQHFTPSRAVKSVPV